MPEFNSVQKKRLENARLSLLGLSVGDAFGQQFFVQPELLATRELPAPQWYYTDDTVMACSVVEVLEIEQHIHQDLLAQKFAEYYDNDPHRGYGNTAHQILRNIADGVPWQQAAGQEFNGSGSMGNGAAMRAAPVGAYFAHDLELVVEQARFSAEVTHAHLDGQAGAIAVAVAAAAASGIRPSSDGPNTEIAAASIVETAFAHTPPGPTKDGIERALKTSLDSDPRSAANALGAGENVISADTVPFCLWAAAKFLTASFEDAMWGTVSGLGDRDTTCAIVGSIVALAHDRSYIPRYWIDHREPLYI